MALVAVGYRGWGQARGRTAPGMLWMHGEYDANTERMGSAYEKNLNFIATALNQLGEKTIDRQ